MDPTSNVTILVTTPVPVELQPETAARLMRAEPGAEQVGFIGREDASGVTLRMAGGEFCGNAAMSAAVLHAMRRGEKAARVRVTVSGTPVETAVRPLGGGVWQGAVDMPRPVSSDTAELGGETLPLVCFDGIGHLILEREPDRAEAEALAPSWCRQLGLPALGLMFLDRAAGRLTPLVYVPAAGTLFWESSCASGTTAVGTYLARSTGKSVDLRLTQPGGTLGISVSDDGAPTLSGTVRMLRRGSA